MVLPTQNLDGTLPELSKEVAPYSVVFEKNSLAFYSEGHPKCTFVVRDESHWRDLLNRDPYQLALAFVNSEFEIDGDLVEAIKIYRSLFENRSSKSFNTLIKYALYKLRHRFHDGSSAHDIQFHYDRSNDFYQSFLDSRMVYSCAYFRSSDDDLEQAQLAKLYHICRKLQLSPGDRFLDIGCGWGSLLLLSADKYGTFSTGCTLSSEQRAWAHRQIENEHLSHRVTILEQNYQELDDKFDKIASVGMFEHVGKKNLQFYFHKMFDLLAAGGLFLNHGIVRPQEVHSSAETLFLTERVFPGGELVSLTDVICCAERAGFEVFDIENLRPHYALTCRAWVKRLLDHREECLDSVSLETYRTWLLYLAASAASFEAAETEIYQVLFLKRGQERPLTRDYVYV